MGVVYAMLAMGLILLIRAVGILNFAQGEMFMFGAYISAALILDFHLPFFAMIPVAMISFIIVGLIFMFTIYWPLRKASYAATTIIATMGAAIVLRELAVLIWGAMPRSMPPLMQTPEGGAAILNIGGTPLPWQFVLIIIVGAALMLLIYLLFEKLYIGKLMQAACQNSYAANLIGIPTILTIAATYSIVSILVSVGGYMVSPIFTVNNTLGTMQLQAFAGVVIGGFGNIKGAIIGSLLVGLIEVFSTINFSAYRDVSVFLVLIVVLLLRPQGLFGEKIADKA